MARNKVVRKADGTLDMRYKGSREAAAKLRNVPKSKKSVPQSAKYTHSVSGDTVTILRNKRNIYSHTVRVDGTNISCGVRQVSGISGLERLFINVPKESHGAIRGAIVHLMNHIKKHRNATFLVASNNTHTPLTNATLDAIAVATSPLKRNNTGNMIKVWTI